MTLGRWNKSYLEALMIFGRLTGRDPRALGDNECSAYELGLSRAEVKGLQQVALDQLAAGARSGAVCEAVERRSSCGFT